MKRCCTRGELILHRSLLLIGKERAVDFGELSAQLLKAGFHQFRGRLAVNVMHRHLIKFATQKAPLDRARLGLRQQALAGCDPDDPQARLVARQGDGDVQRVASGPVDQLFRRVAPTQAEGRLDEGLRSEAAAAKNQEHHAPDQCLKKRGHGRNLAQSPPQRKAGSWRRGFALVEATIAMSLLTVVGLMMLKLSLNILYPRQWVLHQSLADAYMTYERSYAERAPFATVVAAGSPWPVHPQLATSLVEIGRLPGGTAVTGTISRTRLPSSNNYPMDGGSGTLVTNPAGMKVWRVQSILTYQIGGRTYAKSRTVIRSQ